ncbi:hypothetical protein KRP22_011437 [Phytophthora ramorum]|nr:Zinc finger A20 and AN1 domain-containing stress-associated protein 9 [Phytophthora ramorum]
MQQEQATTKLCLNGCGFFGAPGSGGMCSVCWKKTMSDRQAATEHKAEAPKPLETVEEQPKPVQKEDEKQEEQKPVQKNKKRCWECRKKVTLTAIECRCGFVFCGAHRYADQHKCTFDFKASDRAELARLNPGGGQFKKLEKV